MTKTRAKKDISLKKRQDKNALLKRASKNRKLHRKYASSFIVYQNSEGEILHFKSSNELKAYKKKSLKVKQGSVIYPTNHSEFEIQAYIYKELLLMKVDVRGEVRAKNTAGRINILDLVIFQNNEPVMIIEVKKDTTKETTIQKQEYGTFGIPMRFILGMKQAQDYIKRVRSKITV
jgi:hypothetical protein